MKEIQLTKEVVTLVNDDDFDFVSRWRWYLYRATNSNHLRYATRGSGGQMHRLIMGAKHGEYVDHINGDGLDNRKENLRICTQEQNLWNTKMYSSNTSGLRGVRKRIRKDRKIIRWEAMASIGGKNKHIGSFLTQQEAVDAYNAFVVEHRDDYASKCELSHQLF